MADDYRFDTHFESKKEGDYSSTIEQFFLICLSKFKICVAYYLFL